MTLENRCYAKNYNSVKFSGNKIFISFAVFLEFSNEPLFKTVNMIQGNYCDADSCVLKRAPDFKIPKILLVINKKYISLCNRLQIKFYEDE